MNNVATLPTQAVSSNRINRAVEFACNSIAPSWPLDKMIAVNPYWKLKDNHFRDVSARLSALTGIQSVMPHSHWYSLYQNGLLTDDAFERSIAHHNSQLSAEQCVNQLQSPPKRPENWQMLTALFDVHRDETQMQWGEETLYQTSQFCAAYFQPSSPVERIKDPSPANALFRSWKIATQRDSGISILMGTKRLDNLLDALPDDATLAIEFVVEKLALEPNCLDAYFQALVYSINGWASYVAYRCWHSDSDEMTGLLAIALSWEWLIWAYHQHHAPDIAKQVALRWRFEQNNVGRRIQQHYDYETVLWISFVAYEFAQQKRVQSTLLNCAQSAPSPTIDVQAFFCIDVRSEVIRRAFEAQSDTIQTAGFAGFFGMPINYQPAHTCTHRPQLPGLIASDIQASEVGTQATRTESSQRKATWKHWSYSPVGAFSMVESAGWWYAFSLLKKMWFPSDNENPINRLSHHEHWQLTRDSQPLSVEEQASIAAGAIEVMGIKRFAPTVLLIGHASHTTNNLHAAGLDCGACGGQSGEVNVRVLAGLLNDKAVREALLEKGIAIPTNTRFIPGLHNTTTDDVTCFDNNLNSKIKNWLLKARAQAQSERAEQFSGPLQFESDKQRDKLFKLRAKDWSQVRPEWGLAGNHCFIMAPRNWTRNMSFEGRSFLHDYTWQNDPQSTVLEQLMTAPMIVTNWINMQYNASVTDNVKFGSGNKVLHNAVGDSIGVFEGNSGDLRIGLSKQSIHNGKRWMHLPERLSVYIGAPADKISAIVDKHEMLQQLINNEWIYLFRWDKNGTIERLYFSKWYKSAGLTM